MRHVVPAPEVAHLWAHKAQSDARSSGRGNIFFRDSTIYSYGSHFPIARHVTNTHGENAVLFTTRTCSVTTRGHCSMVRGAIPSSVPVFNVHNVMGELTTRNVNTWLDEMQARINDAALKAKRARVHKEYDLEHLKRETQEFKAFAAFADSEREPTLPDDAWFADQAKQAREQNRKNKERREAQERKREAQRAAQRERDKANFEAWFRGENVPFPYSYRDYRSAYLRLHDGEVETSQGARVPLEHVRRVVPFVLDCINSGKTYKANGHTIHLGPYALDAIDAEGNLHAGCHVFSKAELLRFAQVLASMAA